MSDAYIDARLDAERGAIATAAEGVYDDEDWAAVKAQCAPRAVAKSAASRLPTSCIISARALALDGIDALNMDCSVALHSTCMGTRAAEGGRGKARGLRST